jgi:polar amino acid transport system substrate-binding protein
MKKLILALLLTLISTLPAFAADTQKETAYDRVMRTGEIRCGYTSYPPYLMKDVTTGVISGIWHDLTEAVADHLGLKIVWAEEVGYSDISIALDSGRIDMYCTGLWTAGKRVRVVNFLKPSAFEPMLAYVRFDDHRFDTNITKINDPNVSISTMDGEGGGLIAREDFPKAKLVSLPQLSTSSDMFNQVVMRKADVVISAPSGVAGFIKANPGSLRPVPSKPLRVFPVSLVVKYGESDLRDMINQAQEDIIYSGKMDKFISMYEVNKGDFWHVAVPYTVPQQYEAPK